MFKALKLTVIKNRPKVYCNAFRIMETPQSRGYRSQQIVCLYIEPFKSCKALGLKLRMLQKY